MSNYTNMKKTLLTLLLMVLTIPALSLAVQAADSSLRLSLAATTLQISTFYNGTTLEVKGSVPADADIIIQVSGPKKDVHLKQKGKVAGFLWMNKTDVSLENTPAVYMVYTPEGPQESFLRPELGVGYKALLKGITISPESADKDFIFGEYVKLMEKSGVYAINGATVQYGSPRGDVKDFSATLTIPSMMSAGAYEVVAIAVKDGRVLEQAQEALNLELSGLPEIISSMAYDRPLLFGIMAVVIAVATGLLIGFIFRGGGGGAH